MMMNFDTISMIGDEMPYDAIYVPNTPPRYELTSILNIANAAYKTELYKGFMFDLKVTFLFIKYAAM